MKFFVRRAIPAFAILTALFWGPAFIALGELIPEEDLKAAYVYKFIDYVYWPTQSSQAGSATFRVGISGTGPLAENLLELNGRLAKRLPIIASDHENPDELARCQLLFIGPGTSLQLQEILRKIETRPVLTVGDVPDFVRSGGMIGFVVIDNKVRFAINQAAARKAGLEISGQLLNLAVEVIK